MPEIHDVVIVRLMKETYRVHRLGTVSFWFKFQNSVLNHHKVCTDFNLFFHDTCISVSDLYLVKILYFDFTPTDVFLLDVVVIDVM